MLALNGYRQSKERAFISNMWLPVLKLVHRPHTYACLVCYRRFCTCKKSIGRQDKLALYKCAHSKYTCVSAARATSTWWRCSTDEVKRLGTLSQFRLKYTGRWPSEARHASFLSVFLHRRFMLLARLMLPQLANLLMSPAQSHCHCNQLGTITTAEHLKVIFL